MSAGGTISKLWQHIHIDNAGAGEWRSSLVVVWFELWPAKGKRGVAAALRKVAWREIMCYCVSEVHEMMR